MAASRVAALAVCRPSIFAVPKIQCPHPRRTYWHSVNLEDAADDSAVGEQIEIRHRSNRRMGD
jgi:hypothetical protein